MQLARDLNSYVDQTMSYCFVRPALIMPIPQLKHSSSVLYSSSDCISPNLLHSALTFFCKFPTNPEEEIISYIVELVEHKIAV